MKTAATVTQYWVPELFWPEPDDQETLQGLRCPHLEKLLARATWQPQARQMHENLLADLMGYSPETSLAALRWCGDFSTPNAGMCWCTDPVHLRFHHERIVLADASVLNLQDAEVNALVAGLNRDFADLGHFVAAPEGRWYLQCAPAYQSLQASLPSRSEVAGRRLTGEALHAASASEGQAKIRHWQSEIQMWLHAHPVNAARTAAGLPAINGLWFWGGGASPQADHPPHSVMAPASELGVMLRGAATLAGVPCHEPTQPGSAGFQAGLVLDDRLLQPVLYEDAQAWRMALERFDETVLGPLMASGQPATLWTSGVFGVFSVDLSTYRPWAIWRSVKPYAACVQTIAEHL